MKYCVKVEHIDKSLIEWLDFQARYYNYKKKWWLDKHLCCLSCLVSNPEVIKIGKWKFVGDENE